MCVTCNEVHEEVEGNQQWVTNQEVPPGSGSVYMTVMLNKTDWSLFFLLFAAINNTGGQLKCLKMIANHCHRLNLSCFGDIDEFEEITFYIVKLLFCWKDVILWRKQAIRFSSFPIQVIVTYFKNNRQFPLIFTCCSKTVFMVYFWELRN